MLLQSHGWEKSSGSQRTPSTVVASGVVRALHAEDVGMSARGMCKSMVGTCSWVDGAAMGSGSARLLTPSHVLPARRVRDDLGRAQLGPCRRRTPTRLGRRCAAAVRAYPPTPRTAWHAVSEAYPPTPRSSRGPFHDRLVPIERERDCPKICRSPLPASAQAEKRGPQPTLLCRAAYRGGTQHTDPHRSRTVATNHSDRGTVRDPHRATERAPSLHHSLSQNLARGGWVGARRRSGAHRWWRRRRGRPGGRTR